MNDYPQFVKDIIEQLGGLGFRGAPGYVGGHDFLYVRPEVTYPLYPHPHDGIFQFKTNTKKKSVMLIAVELMDTYYVALFIEGQPYGEPYSGVYCDQLKKLVEDMYDGYIKEQQGGGIHLS